ncbi:hypothetical protein ANN_11308 [Periplaneta americana]|uniref:CGG triplet repeat-binding protein 1 n=1 Tax=Periplaneta americana TaxID=6978 RepID=A0ABQ8T675_PERAM|nr:hypothetical protein ANN_11308 [Periplaneta americana]
MLSKKGAALVNSEYFLSPLRITPLGIQFLFRHRRRNENKDAPLNVGIFNTRVPSSLRRDKIISMISSEREIKLGGLCRRFMLPCDASAVTLRHDDPMTSVVIPRCENHCCSSRHYVVGLNEKDFSCAAQQLNASQSTHRFSFVNHTIKTVNMPKVRHSVNLKSKLTSYISEFKEDGLSTDNKILFCNLCQCAVSSTQKFLVQQHITTSKHQANKQLNSKQRQLFLTQPTTSNVRSEFNIDLCRSLISADIPLYKLKNKVFREFLEKYTQHTIPDESTLRKTYAPSIYDETIQKIRDEIKDSSIWVSIDETPDKEAPHYNAEVKKVWDYLYAYEGATFIFIGIHFNSYFISQ